MCFRPTGQQGTARVEYAAGDVMLTIDGSQGEGGGQILRTSLALSLLESQPITIAKIRAGRKKPGLLRQHLTAVLAAAEIGHADVTGAELGSQKLVFAPSRPEPGDHHFSVGSAGSATLVLQTVLPALMTCDGASTLTLEGGTHNPFAPPFDFLVKSFLPLIGRMGPKIEAELKRPGFYPAGGGHMTVSVEPSRTLAALDLTKRGEISHRGARVLISKLPRHVAERETQVLEKRLGWPADCLSIEEVRTSLGPGNVVMIELGSADVMEVFTGFGQRGVKAERVAARVVQEAKRYLDANVPVGEHLADQLLLPLALAGHGSFTTTKPSRHTETNIEVIGKFFDDIVVSTTQLDGSAWRFDIKR